jgi:large subunit ribosomal protein L22
MEAIAHARFQRFGTRKVGQVLKEIRGKSVLQAEQIIPMIPRACNTMV